MWTLPACVSDLTRAATEIARHKNIDAEELGASTQAFGLFIFAFSCGFFFGPAVAGIIKAKTDWGTATVILACTCILACIPIVSPSSMSMVYLSLTRDCQVVQNDRFSQTEYRRSVNDNLSIAAGRIAGY